MFLLTEGALHDHKGGMMLLPSLPQADVLLADKAYDSDELRAALAERRMVACIPSRKRRKVAIPYNKKLYEQRNRIERMFARLKDWRRVATRYDRCAHTFFSAICLAATVIFYLGKES
jgi:transposase